MKGSCSVDSSALAVAVSCPSACCLSVSCSCDLVALFLAVFVDFFVSYLLLLPPSPNFKYALNSNHQPNIRIRCIISLKNSRNQPPIFSHNLSLIWIHWNNIRIRYCLFTKIAFYQKKIKIASYMFKHFHWC